MGFKAEEPDQEWIVYVKFINLKFYLHQYQAIKHFKWCGFQTSLADISRVRISHTYDHVLN